MKEGSTFPSNKRVSASVPEGAGMKTRIGLVFSLGRESEGMGNVDKAVFFLMFYLFWGEST